MSDALSVGVSTYAILEADEARQAAEAAELRAFVSGYSHVSATPAERQRYVEAVQKMYPPTSREIEISVATKQFCGGIIVAAFAWFAVGAAVGKFYYHDVEEGVAMAFLLLLYTAVFAGGAGLLGMGVALLLGLA